MLELWEVRSLLDREIGGGPKGPATQNFPPPAGKKPDAVAVHQTTAESALLYRYVSHLYEITKRLTNMYGKIKR
jgi:hypothetical protein